MSTTRADSRTFNVDQQITIVFNWQSFWNNGFNSAWQSHFEDAVMNAANRWVNVSGARFRVVKGGTTTATSASSGQVLIQANEAHAVARLASAFGGSNSATIFFHRKDVVGGTPWDWRPWFAPTAGIDFEAVAVHELGHALGFLDDLPDTAANARRTMNGNYNWLRMRYGPYSGDVDAMRALYGATTALGINSLETSSNATSFSSVNMSSCGVIGTTSEAAAVVEGTKLTFFTSDPYKHPLYRVANTSGTCNAGTTFFGGERSFYGTSAASNGSKYMWTWVDNLNDDNNIRVVYSGDGGASWAWANPPASGTTGTPAILHVMGTTWALAYSKLNWADANNTGDVTLRISTNDGASWGPELNVGDVFWGVSARSGVSMTAMPASGVSRRLVIGVGTANYNEWENTGQVRWFTTDVTNTSTGTVNVAGTTLDGLGWGWRTGTYPALAQSGGVIAYAFRASAGISNAMSYGTFGYYVNTYVTPSPYADLKVPPTYVPTNGGFPLYRLTGT